MGKLAEYITRIEIKSLWSGKHHIIWNLTPDVNVLSGINGVGKSTILRKSISNLRQKTDELSNNQISGVTISFYPEEATTVKFDEIRSMDRPLIHANLIEKMADEQINTELDWQLYLLQRRYLDYQVNLGNRMIDLLTKGDAESQQKATEVSKTKGQFQDMVDALFRETCKTIVRQSNEILFEQLGERLTPYQLSSGEKQILVILLTVLIQDHQHYVLFMDEPEVSLHIDWQQQLIGLVRKLNPNVQIILTTHSPAVIMNGWMDAVTEVSDITE